MEREYIRRRSGGPVMRPSHHRRRPPWVVWVLLALALIVAATFIIVKVSESREKEGTSPPPSSAVSLAESSPVSQILDQPVSPPPQATPDAPAVMPEQTAPEADPEDWGDLMTADGAGYEYYHFDESATNDYITAVASAASSLSGSATLYNLVVPTSMDVMLPESYIADQQIDSSQQSKALDSYIIPSINAMAPDVKTVPLYTALRQRCDQYIYFRTDRTWTQQGAYYAYREFCGAKGVQPLELDQFEKKEYSGFMGGFAAQAGEERFIADTVEAYLPGGATSLRFTDQNGEVNEDWAVISNGENYSSSLLYLIFAAGDQPYKVLENSDISDGSACVVVQDSFGNFFIPFLTQHYQYVYAVDYRYYQGSVPQLVSDTGASDVILLNHILATSSADGVSSLSGLF